MISQMELVSTFYWRCGGKSEINGKHLVVVVMDHCNLLKCNDPWTWSDRNNERLAISLSVRLPSKGDAKGKRNDFHKRVGGIGWTVSSNNWTRFYIRNSEEGIPFDNPIFRSSDSPISLGLAYNLLNYQFCGIIIQIEGRIL